jgi:hypothetical protein
MLEVRQTAAITLQSHLKESINIKIDYSKESLSFIEGLIVSSLIDFELESNIESELENSLVHIYGCQRWIPLYKNTA